MGNCEEGDVEKKERAIDKYPLPDRPPLIISARALLGRDIEDVAAAMARLSQSTGCSVEVKFNDMTLLAHPTTAVKEIVEQYWRKR